MLTWKPLDSPDFAQVPESIRPWLADRYSLTRRLKQFCGGRFSVAVLYQQDRLPDESEQVLLDIVADQKLIERRVNLLNTELPLVFARSLIPLSAVKGEYQNLAQMGNRPLGEQLFNDPTIKRGEIEWCCMRPGDKFYSAAVDNLVERPAMVYARRSLFHGAPATLMVSEYFLPGLPDFVSIALP